MLSFSSVLKHSIKAHSHQTIRWRRPRKPFWLGVAKSKMFLIPKTRKIPEDEKKEIFRLEKLYATELRSLLKFIKENPIRDKNHEENPCDTNAEKKLALEIEESLLRNEEWNRVSAQFREERIKDSLEKLSVETAKKIEQLKVKDKEHIQKSEEIVKNEKMLSQTFITPENLDEAIEACLENIVDYNFAIDLEGRKYSGEKFQKEEEVS